MTSHFHLKGYKVFLLQKNETLQEDVSGLAYPLKLFL